MGPEGKKLYRRHNLLLLSKLDLKEESKNQGSVLRGCYVVVVKLLSHISNFCDPMDCNLPGPSVHGIPQAKMLEWVAISSSCVDAV